MKSPQVNGAVTIEKLIEQLQAVAKENPGMLCVLNDQEWGVDSLNIGIERIYNADKDMMPMLMLESTYKQGLKNIEEYQEENAAEAWLEIEKEMKEDPSSISYFRSYEHLKESYKEIADAALEDIKRYEKSEKYVVFQMKTV